MSQQLFANNASTTLALSISDVDTSLTVTDSSIFPVVAADQFFLATIELNSVREIVKITNITGNVFTIGARAQEGTTARSWPAGSIIECRITRDTLNRFSKNLISLTSVENLGAPVDTVAEAYLCFSLDTVDSPTIAVKHDNARWRFTNYTKIGGGTATSGSTTTLNDATITLPSVIAGKYLIQITNGILEGQVRQVSSATGTSVTWSTALGSTVLTGSTYELFQDNSTLASSGAGAYVQKAGDTMTGALSLPTDGLNVGGGQLVVGAGGIGFGISPSAWSGLRGLDTVGSAGVFGGATGGSSFSGIETNCYFDGTNWRYKTSGPASLIITGNAINTLYYAIFGSPGGIITWQTALTTDNTGRVSMPHAAAIGGAATIGGTLAVTGAITSPATAGLNISGNAATATFATTANSATTAVTATSATTAVTATTATNATNAVNATNAGTASIANSVSTNAVTRAGILSGSVSTAAAVQGTNGISATLNFPVAPRYVFLNGYVGGTGGITAQITTTRNGSAFQISPFYSIPGGMGVLAPFSIITGTVPSGTQTFAVTISGGITGEVIYLAVIAFYS